MYKKSNEVVGKIIKIYTYQKKGDIMSKYLKQKQEGYNEKIFLKKSITNDNDINTINFN